MDWILQLLTRTSPWVSVLLAALMLTTGLFFGLRSARLHVTRRTAGHRRLGRDGNILALQILTRAGFRVLETEVTARGTVSVDGALQEFTVRCDAIVSRGSKKYVAEFKGGTDSARIENRATRRQLLEYAWVFGVDALLLVDASTKAVHVIAFP